MTIGDLARRTGVPVKVLRRHEDMRLIYTRGRSPAGYRLFDEDALWCVGLIRDLRSLGLTEAEIQQLADNHSEGCQLVGPQLAEILRRVRARTQARIRELEQLRWRVENFERRHRPALEDRSVSDPWGPDPKRADMTLDPPTGGRP